MRFLLILSVIFNILISKTVGQNLDKVRLLCLDEVNLEQYNGELSKKELQKQVAALGFRYIENGEIKYHNELIVYDCNTGDVKFTANFDENRLVKNFVLYESEGVPAKKIRFSKKPTSDNVDLKFKYKGQEIPAFPVGKTEIYKKGNLVKTILFDEGVPFIKNYNLSGKKTSEGPASISGYIKNGWDLNKLGEWKYFNNGQIVSTSVFDKSGNLQSENKYSKGKVKEERNFLANGSIEIKSFYDNGKLKEKGVIHDQVRNGTWKFFNSKGVLKEKTEYRKGKEVGKLTYNKQENVIKELALVKDNSKLLTDFQKGDLVYQVKTYYPDGTLQSKGYQTESSKAGIYEYFNKEGKLSKIVEYSRKGRKLNSVDANTYLAIQDKENKVYRELLVAKTTHPANLNLLNRIESLTQRLEMDYDSLIMGYEYKKDYEDKYSKISSETSDFGQLSNTLKWYDSLLNATVAFNNKVWEYSHDLQEIELALEKVEALKAMENLKIELTEKYTSTKNTLFGEKIVVMNDQEAIYETITEEIYPAFTESIKESENKYRAASTVKEFAQLLDKGSMIIEQPNEEFQKALDNTNSINDKKKLFLSIK